MLTVSSPTIKDYSVTVKDVTKTYGKLKVLDGVSFNVGSSQFVSLVGSSGCGKSTCLKIIAGLIPRTSGTVMIGDAPVSGPVVGTGIVFQQPSLLPWRSTLENILLPVELSGDGKAKYRERAQALIKLVGLEGFEKAFPHKLSGGMEQRTAICRSLILDSPVLLMDEPFGALDALTREMMWVELGRIWAASKRTLVFVTHSIEEAVFLSDVVVVFSKRPAVVKATFEVDIPRPRGKEIFTNQRFVELTSRIRNQLEI
jgi:NitT/TauT family transport system ATP-binding protein